MPETVAIRTPAAKPRPRVPQGETESAMESEAQAAHEKNALGDLGYYVAMESDWHLKWAGAERRKYVPR